MDKRIYLGIIAVGVMLLAIAAMTAQQETASVFAIPLTLFGSALATLGVGFTILTHKANKREKRLEQNIARRFQNS